MLDVPLLLWGPGVPRGVRVSEPVAHVDVVPTLLELAGIAAPESLMGRSLVPLMRSRSDAAPRPVYSETPEGQRPGLAVRVGNRKLIRLPDGPGERQLYFDLASDPGEERALPAEQAADLAALLDAYRVETARRRAALLDGAAASREPLDVDPERSEKLRALGYVE